MPSGALTHQPQKDSDRKMIDGPVVSSMYWEPVEASLILELVQEINITWTLNASLMHAI